MKNLYIDTRDNTKVVARLTTHDNSFESISQGTSRPESILNLVEDVCIKAGISISDIDEITVEEGPGSYTGLKVGASVANALSLATGKPVNEKKIGDFVTPTYE